MEKWIIQSKRADFLKIGKKYNIDPVIARIIRNRDIIEDNEIKNYLYPDIQNMNSPWLFKDMDKAVDILKIKISQGNKIRIICDYDVDGICSGYILVEGLRKVGANVDFFVPHRIEDGYGINRKIIEKANLDNVDTILTCDNGIAAIDEILYAKSLGMTVIITDHHEVHFDMDGKNKVYRIPPADAVVDNKQIDCEYPFKELCGAMVAYQLIVALYDSMGKNTDKYYNLLCYAAMATVCDIVELKGENRTVVKYGLELLKTTKDVGINELISVCNINKNEISAYHLGFIIGPCINASGRLESAKIALNLLLEEDRDKAKDYASKLKELNKERKEMTEKGAISACQTADKMKDNILVIYLPDCHESVAGIIAGRVKEKYNKPTIILTNGEDCVKGSGRSIESYNMYEELNKVKSLFIKFGGHKMAAGVSLNPDNIEVLRIALNNNSNLTKEDMELKVWIDTQLPLEYITMDFIKQLDLLQPCGKGNEKPLFAENNLKIVNMKIIGKTGNAIKMTVENKNNYRMAAMIFGRSQEFLKFLKDKFGEDQIKLAMEGKNNKIIFMATYCPNINEYNGNIKIQMIISRFC